MAYLVALHVTINFSISIKIVALVVFRNLSLNALYPNYPTLPYLTLVEFGVEASGYAFLTSVAPSTQTPIFNLWPDFNSIIYVHLWCRRSIT